MPLIQPRLGSVEEWTFVNHNNDEHPIHVHVNDFQVTEYFDPTTGPADRPRQVGHGQRQRSGADHADRRERDPARHPLDAHEVRRLHRALRHALPSPQPRGQRADGAHQRHTGGLHLRGGRSRRAGQAGARCACTTATATGSSPRSPRFPGFEGSVSVAMGDVDDDGVLDLIVGAGKGHAPEVVAYAGKAEDGKGAFATELARFQRLRCRGTRRHQRGCRADRWNERRQHHRRVGARHPERGQGLRLRAAASPGTAPALFATFSPYADDRSGVSLAAGFVDFATGRNSIVTAPGPGSPAEVKVFAFPLLTPIGHGSHAGDGGMHAGGSGPACEHRGVHAVRQRLSRRRFARDRLAGRLARRRRADRRQPARRRRHGEGLLQRLGAGRRAGPVSAQPVAARPRRRSSARSRASTRSTDRRAPAWRPRARHPAPTCWSAASRKARASVLKYDSSERTHRRQRWRPCVWDRCTREQGCSRRSSPATEQSAPHTFATLLLQKGQSPVCAQRLSPSPSLASGPW